ncbi:26S proteasome non-ATPase regulatory subunit 9 [Tetranychus urticae]|uniref:Nas2 N-terminal domain-containing protein n=1 Tax=Tetranychus urticae TaxID=32264 RepID=T1JZC6_TETUR|nr:26S proteasome non-ATPase regulatory subunit 9 [Tetranychus urticae]
MSSEESEKVRKELLDLQKKRADLEQEILVYQDILKSLNIGMNEPLVDKEGFPRNDVDIYQVRTARNKIVCLSNDCKALTEQMEKKLHEFHAMSRPGNGTF